MKCKTGAMMMALPAMPMIALMRMSRMGACWATRGEGPDAGRNPDACCADEPGAGDWAVTVKKRSVSRRNIVETAVAAGAFGTLIEALKAADLVSALEGDGPFTVFAPTDEAFGKLPKGTLEQLLGDKNKLASVLKYHVLSGEFRSDDLESVVTARTLQGQGLPVDTAMGVRVGPAHVIKADIVCANGVIHAIDSVLLPE